MDLPQPAEVPIVERSSAQAPSAVETFMQPLRGLLAHDVTEVVINRPGEVWTEGREGWQVHAMPELTYDHLRTFATLIANSTQQTIHESAPLVSAAPPHWHSPPKA